MQTVAVVQIQITIYFLTSVNAILQNKGDSEWRAPLVQKVNYCQKKMKKKIQTMINLKTHEVFCLR